MKYLSRGSFAGLIVAGLLAMPLSTHAGPKTEDQLIAEMDSPSADKVASAMLAIEKEYPTSTKAFPKMKVLLKDNRPKVRRKAARGLHPPQTLLRGASNATIASSFHRAVRSGRRHGGRHGQRRIGWR